MTFQFIHRTCYGSVSDRSIGGMGVRVDVGVAELITDEWEATLRNRMQPFDLTHIPGVPLGCGDPITV